jgi:hypothetical protein
LQTEEFDVVHIHSPLVAIGTRLAIRSLPRGKRPRIVVTEHNVWGSHAPLTRWADHLTAGKHEVHLAVSAAVLESMPADVRARTRVVRYGIDAAEIRRQASPTTRSSSGRSRTSGRRRAIRTCSGPRRP